MAALSGSDKLLFDKGENFDHGGVSRWIFDAFLLD
jgi:hypothetical protein